MNASNDKIAQDIAKGMADVMEMLAPIEEAVRGYRAKLEKEGWSPAVSEQMSMQLYSLMMMKAFGLNP